ncbi:MAG TPA: hypothetical protein VMW36_00765 [Patescibacteria group bacterium]|nr:hypothetical protein [Patescibacteria group bacterium]
MDQVTLGAVVLLFVAAALKSLFDWIKQKNLQNTEERLSVIEKTVIHIDTKVVELHKWHDIQDSDGVPIWYVRKSLEEIIRQNGEAVQALSQQSFIQTQVLQELVKGQSEMLSEMRNFYLQNKANSHD